MDAAIARVHAFDNGKTYRRAALDDPTAHDRLAYDGDMDDITDPADALRGLRQLLHRLESRQMSVNQGGTERDHTGDCRLAMRDRATETNIVAPISLGVNEKPGLVV